LNRTHLVEVELVKTLSITSGPLAQPAPFPFSAAIEFLYDQNFPNNHREITFLNGCKIDSINVWEGPAKLTLLFSKVFSYTSTGLISSVLATKFPSGSKLLKTLNRDVSGKIISVDRVFTP
jgi:hypothetical protein